MDLSTASKFFEKHTPIGFWVLLIYLIMMNADIKQIHADMQRMNKDIHLIKTNDIQHIHHKIDTSIATLNRKIDQINTQFNNRFDQLNSQFNARFDKLYEILINKERRRKK